MSALIRWRLRALFLLDGAQLKRQFVLIAVVLTCAITPTGIAGYYSVLASGFHPAAWLITVAVGIALLFFHGRTHPRFEEIFAYEKALPMPRSYRSFLDFLDAIWVQF